MPNRLPSPWLTPEIALAKRERRQAERQWRSSGLTIHKQIFNTARSKVCNMISAAKRKHLQSKILNSTSSKNLYSTMNDLLGASTDSPLPTAQSQNELPSLFSTYFHDKIQALRDTLETLPSKPPPPDPPFIGTPLSSFHPVSQEEVLKTIKSMSLKTCELDPLPASLYSEGLLQLLPFITDIINTSLQTGTTNLLQT